MDPFVYKSPPLRVVFGEGTSARLAEEADLPKDRNPVVSLMAAGAIRTIAGALPHIVRTPDNRDARSRALYGAWLSGLCLDRIGVQDEHIGSVAGIRRSQRIDRGTNIALCCAEGTRRSAPEAGADARYARHSSLNVRTIPHSHSRP